MNDPMKATITRCEASRLEPMNTVECSDPFEDFSDHELREQAELDAAERRIDGKQPISRRRFSAWVEWMP